MSEKIKSVEDLIVYKKSVELFNAFIEEDLPILRNDAAGRMLYGNQLRCLDSICANMEEGFERKGGKEIKYFFRMSKGSSGGAKGRYKRLKFALTDDIILKRVNLLSEIRAMLDSLIKKWE